MSAEPIRHDWNLNEITALFDLPFNDLLFQAHSTHREHFDPNRVQAFVSGYQNERTLDRRSLEGLRGEIEYAAAIEALACVADCDLRNDRPEDVPYRDYRHWVARIRAASELTQQDVL